jgi:hypothetical protein
MFRAAAVAGDADVRHYAHVHDRHLAVRDGVQELGTLMVPNDRGSPEFVVPLIADEATANERRRELTLPTLEMQRQEWLRCPNPGPFLIPTRRRHLIAVAATLEVGLLRHRWSPRP